MGSGSCCGSGMWSCSPAGPPRCQGQLRGNEGLCRGEREGAAQHGCPKAALWGPGGHRALSGGTAHSGRAVPSRTGSFSESRRGFGTAGGSEVGAQCRDREVKPSGSIPVPSSSSSFGLPLLPPHAQTPVLPPGPGWGCQRLFLLLSRTSPTVVPSLGSPSRDQRPQSSPCAPTGVSRAGGNLGTSAWGAPGAAPTPRISQCGNWSLRATKLPVFHPKTTPTRLPRPPLPLFSVLLLRAGTEGSGGVTLPPGSVQGQLRAPQRQPGPGCPRTGLPHAGHAGGLPPSVPQLSPHLQQPG